MVSSSSLEPDLARAGVRQRDHHVLRGDHAEVAMRGLGGVHEVGRCAGAGERGGELAPDVARLAHAGDDHPPVACEDDLDRALELLADAGSERVHGLGLDAQHTAGEGDGTAFVRSGNWVHGFDALNWRGGEAGG